MEYACNAVKILQNGEIIRQNIIWCFANMEICIIFASEFRDIVALDARNKSKTSIN